MDEIQSNFAFLLEILSVVESLGDDFLVNVDLTLLQRELTKVYEAIFTSPLIINYINTEDQIAYFKDKYEEALLKISLLEEELRFRSEDRKSGNFKKERKSTELRLIYETPELKNRIIEEFYQSEEHEYEENVRILANLNTQLLHINREKNEDIENLQDFLEDFRVKNQNLLISNQRFLHELENQARSESELQERLKDLEKTLEKQDEEKFHLESKIKELEGNYEREYRSVIDLQQKKDLLSEEIVLEEKACVEAIEEKTRKLAKKSIFARNLESIRFKNSAISTLSFTKLLDSPKIEKEEITEEKIPLTAEKRRKKTSLHKKQKSLCLAYERLAVSDGRRVDLCEIETKATKDEKNTNFSFLSVHDLKRRTPELDNESEEKRIAKNNERIMNYIRAKKMQRSVEKRGFLPENEGKKCSNHCEQCSIF